MKNFDCFIIAILFGTILPSAISQVSTIYEQGLNNGKWATQARTSFEYNEVTFLENGNKNSVENYLYLEPQGWQLVQKDTFSYDDQGLLTSAQHASFDYGNLAFVDTTKYYYFCDKLLSEERTANFRRLYEYYQGLDCFDYREPEVTIYPNPAYDNHILVQSPILLSAETKIKLYNAAGILLTVSEVGYRAEKAEITLPDLPNGLYLLSLSALDMQVTKKLVVQH